VTPTFSDQQKTTFDDMSIAMANGMVLVISICIANMLWLDSNNPVTTILLYQDLKPALLVLAV